MVEFVSRQDAKEETIRSIHPSFPFHRFLIHLYVLASWREIPLLHLIFWGATSILGPEPIDNFGGLIGDLINMKETIRVGQIEINFLLEAADTNGALALFEFKVPVEAKVPLPHYHQQYDETIYGVEGVVTFTVEGKAVEIGPGDSCFIPRGAVHGFNNLKQVDAKALAIVTPALLGPAFFKETAAIVNAGGPPDLERLKGVLARHGLVAVTPPV